MLNHDIDSVEVARRLKIGHDFILAVIRKLPPDLPLEVMEKWVADEDGLRRVLSNTLISQQPLDVLDDLIRRGGYQRLNMLIRSSNAPPYTYDQLYSSEISYLHLYDGSRMTEDVVAELSQRDLALPDDIEFIWYDIRNASQLSEARPVAILGSVWTWDGQSYSLFVCRVKDVHYLGLHALSEPWPPNYLFAVKSLPATPETSETYISTPIGIITD